MAEDPFSQHFETDLTEDEIAELDSGKKTTEKSCWPNLKILVTTRNSKKKENIEVLPLTDMHFKKSLLEGIKTAIKFDKNAEDDQTKLSSFQLELLSIFTSYSDFYFSERTFQNGESIRLCYCLHSLNHILKARSKIVHHNAKLKQNRNSDALYRDCNLTRPSVLIVVPFREAGLRVVNMLISILTSGEKVNVMNKKRFQTEFSEDEDQLPSRLPRPKDYNEMFAGNIDDSFRLGIQINKKTLNLYSDFYSSDIIVASPLGLRTIIGASGDKNRDYDFLSSIEILIIDQADVYLMQNWEHVLHLMDHLHLQLQDSHDADFSRVRMWGLNGWAKYYRQTLIFSDMVVPSIISLFNKHCHNYAGKIVLRNPVPEGILSQVIVPYPQVFHRFSAESNKAVVEERFNFLFNEILPTYINGSISHTLVFVQSYFDFIRLRNRFKNKEYSFVHISEYTSNTKIASARDLFYHGEKNLLLCTERFHFFKRYQLKGVQNIIFYELPLNPHFYSEICNFINFGKSGNSGTITVLYSEFDFYPLSYVVGTDRALKMVTSEGKVHMFVTGQN